MKTTKQWIAILIFIILVLTLSACHSKSTPLETPPQYDSDRLVIGFSMATYKEDRWLRDRDIFIAKAAEAGFEVIVQNANNNSQKQVDQVAGMIAEGIDVLVIAPQDAEDAARAVDKAKKAGVPVISYDRLIRNAPVDVYISFDNFRVGELMGQAIVKAVPNGNYVVLNGSENDNNSKMFREGYMSVLTPLLEQQKITLLGEKWVSDWRREAAYDYITEVFDKNGNAVDAIVAANDSLAWAAIDVLSERRLVQKVKVVGHDADLAACQRIVDGAQLMTVYKPISKLVDETVKLCVQLEKHKTIKTDAFIDNGKFNIPYVKIDVLSVTKETMDDTVIKDGFHLKEDVYKK